MLGFAFILLYIVITCKMLSNWRLYSWIRFTWISNIDVGSMLTLYSFSTILASFILFSCNFVHIHCIYSSVITLYHTINLYKHVTTVTSAPILCTLFGLLQISIINSSGCMVLFLLFNLVFATCMYLIILINVLRKQ